MSSLKAHEKVIFEKLFDRGGYVLNFNDPSYAEFFREHGISIDDAKYRFNGTSKMKRLRAFWEVEPDQKVGTVLEALLEYAAAWAPIAEGEEAKARQVIARLMGMPISAQKVAAKTETDFLQQSFQDIDCVRLNIDPGLQAVIAQRFAEIKITLKGGAALATIFLCGSTLEGLLLDAAAKEIARFNTAESAPKAKDGKVKPLHEWTLDNLINVAHEVGVLSLDVKKYGHALRDFRNYIHPRQQAVQKFSPDEHTAKISWQVLQAAIAGLSGQRNK